MSSETVKCKCGATFFINSMQVMTDGAGFFSVYERWWAVHEAHNK